MRCPPAPGEGRGGERGGRTDGQGHALPLEEGRPPPELQAPEGLRCKGPNQPSPRPPPRLPRDRGSRVVGVCGWRGCRNTARLGGVRGWELGSPTPEPGAPRGGVALGGRPARVPGSRRRGARGGGALTWPCARNLYSQHASTTWEPEGSRCAAESLGLILCTIKHSAASPSCSYTSSTLNKHNDDIRCNSR